MKKTYVTPDVEKVAFQYRDQVVVASNNLAGACLEHYTGAQDLQCKHHYWSGNNENLNS